ncbi:O-antigen ligase [Clostridium sp. CF012]|uniref:O-antigen ligase family protein n=1 Tax=Clostridium sp. CF012 TaxID=2843319 RepID=UPI001C0B0BD7|nr:O-antigen ligase family protein [Clostridium sp. CF012]MBU3142018.1 O-antigen ligase family protein [Clostridium sp. CF012]
MDSLKKQILNKTNIVYTLITLMMLSTIAIISPVTTKFNIVILAWGALYLLYDFFKEKNCMKSRYSFYLKIYMILFLISIIINFKVNLIGNIKTFAYTGLFLFVLYSYRKDYSDKTMQSEIYNINTIIITISSIASFASLLTFMFLIQFTYSGTPQGFVYPHAPALWGFYRNPNSGGMVAVVSIIVTFFNIYLCNKIHVKNFGKLKKSYYYFNILVQWLCLLLCNSRGALLSLLAFVLFASFYLFINIFEQKKKFNRFKSVMISLLLTIIIFSTFNLAVSVSKIGLSYIPKSIQKLINNTDPGLTGEDPDNLIIDREIQDGHVTTGRMEIWTYGLNTLKLNPLFGHGPDNIGLAKQKIYPNDKTKYMITNDMHNGYLQILLSNGILAFIAFGAFIILIIKDSLIFLLSKKNTADNNKKIFLFFILGLILSIAVNGLFENAILLTRSYIPTILWIYLSYLSKNLDEVKELNKSNV